MVKNPELSLQEKLDSIKSVAKGGEIIEDDGQLKWLLENRKPGEIIAYDGFEPSGRIHIAQGLMRAININKLTRSGVKFVMYVADWHAAANQKFGGDLKVIKKVGDYFVEVWKACGMDLKNIEFVYASELVKDPDYWQLVLKISMMTTLNRILRCGQIMGRNTDEVQQSSQILYPLMQCADIFVLKTDICQLGLDQRKVNMLAREVARPLGFKKPMSIHHHMLMGLGKPPETDLGELDKKIARKMSKSNPDSAIFMLDTKAEIKRKINKAWCPSAEIKENPVLEYCKYIIFEKFDKFKVKRPEKYGGNVSYSSYNELEVAYENGNLSPVDLKMTAIEYLDKLLTPVREHFENDPEAKKLFTFVQNAMKKQTKKKK
ncbi:tyrosine--tRNA ligase [Promethearchaeum syntrophicum]|uniref:tyrosine--tRNA ligase n=1 Tax=Promethearchaeum syntrophicum TaxID=2594042 RepID=A0A5B9DG16_9ARCH|nr:tyrosine--tRNA ligase [Candidatus Prometheoarchaeum syntrophicum]QEE17961.1 Tyrosine--tRNA ligase [Candidatus Prometheoarchaeum syntrophicum]